MNTITQLKKKMSKIEVEYEKAKDKPIRQARLLKQAASIERKINDLKINDLK